MPFSRPCLDQINAAQQKRELFLAEQQLGLLAARLGPTEASFL